LAPAWTSPVLAGQVYGNPLVYRGTVVVATESDDVYALDEATGRLDWHVNVGQAVPAGELPCGDISPTVGITSTPVIDPATGRVFVVADTWDGANASSIHHQLFGLNLADGSPVSGLPVRVDPPQNDPTAVLQRTALALDEGKIIVGYGGNDGDCATYNGWLIATPESGAQQEAFQVEPTASGGAIWGSGNGPAVDSSGDIWVTTGNGFGSGYGYQESVLKLDADLNLLDHWAPAYWQFLDLFDLDLGSADPLLLPDALVFAIGKQGVGYLLSASSLGGTGASPPYSAQVCGGSFGGAVYYQGVIYVSCADGLRALTLNTTTRTFAAVSGWQVNSTAIGPPIVAGGLVWATGWSSQRLFGLDPRTGQTVVDQPTAAMAHFATPSAANGKLFLATGTTVEAYNIAYTLVTTGTSLDVSFGARSIAVGQTTPLTITAIVPSARGIVGRASRVITATATLSRGLVVASPSHARVSCGRATLAATPGTRTIVVSGQAGATSRCNVTVGVTGTLAGVKTTTITVASRGLRAEMTPHARLNVQRRSIAAITAGASDPRHAQHR
jgi:outer membrane protein assembly factor BamB